MKKLIFAILVVAATTKAYGMNDFKKFAPRDFQQELKNRVANRLQTQNPVISKATQQMFEAITQKYTGDSVTLLPKTNKWLLETGFSPRVAKFDRIINKVRNKTARKYPRREEFNLKFLNP